MSSTGRSERWQAGAVCLLLALLVFAAFGDTLRHGFINLDDDEYVLHNAHVRAGLTAGSVAWAFTHSYSANWHPLTWISHMLDCQLYGLAPAGHHLTNLLLHSASAIALFLVWWRMTGALARSAVVAALFAIHPLRVESVAWISERKDVLSGLFFMLTLGAYAAYARRPDARRYALVLILFALGLMAKPMLVTLPFVLLLLDYWPLQRQSGLRKLALEKLPLLLLSAASAVVTLFAQRDVIQPLARISIPLRLGNAIEATVVYLRQLFWPVDLAVLYPWTPNRVTAPAVVGCAALLVAITVAVVGWRRRRRHLVTGWLWFLVMLLPVIGIVQVGAQAHADRYTYLPHIGLLIAMTWSVADLVRQRIVLGAATATALMGLLILSRAQVTHWRDSESLWTHTILATSNHAVISIDPSTEVYLGHALSERGKLAEAIARYQNAIGIDPNHAPACSALGVALLETGDAAGSLSALQRAAELNPDYGEAHYNLGNTLVALGDAPGAVAQYSRAIDLNSSDYQACNNLAWLLATSPSDRIRDVPRAVDLAMRADALTAGGNPFVAATLAAALAEAGRFPEATKAAERAVALAEREGDSVNAENFRAQLARYQGGRTVRGPR